MSGVIVLAVGAVLAALAVWWTLRAYRGADAAPTPPRAPLIASALACASALGIYLFVGDPFLPDGAHADRMAALKQRAPETYTAEEAIAVLHEIARSRSSDPGPMVMIADLEAKAGRVDAAVSAFSEALRREPRSVEALVGMAVVLSARERGAVTPYARDLLTRARALAPDNPDPVFYLALAAQQAGELEEARRLWRTTISMLPPDDPRRAMAAAMLERR